MESPALRHKNRILATAAQFAADAAAKAGAPLAPAAAAIGNKLAVVLAALESARVELKNMNTLAERVTAKRQRYIPMLEGFIAEYMNAGEIYQNPALVWFTLWLFDIRDMERALQYAEICIAQQQSMPDDWRRDMETYAVDETLDWAQQCCDDGVSASPYFDDVLSKMLSGEWRVNEQIQVKACKLAGKMLHTQGERQAALDFYLAAQRISGGKAGVKTVVDQLTKELATASKGSPE